MTVLEKFIRGLDVQQPDWWIRFADMSDLQDCVRACTDGRSGTVAAKERLRGQTARRLLTAVRGAQEGGLTKVIASD